MKRKWEFSKAQQWVFPLVNLKGHCQVFQQIGLSTLCLPVQHLVCHEEWLMACDGENSKVVRWDDLLVVELATLLA